jgi:hypothetical protein
VCGIVADGSIGFAAITGLENLSSKSKEIINHVE